MNKYIEAMGRLCNDSAAFTLMTFAVGAIVLVLFMSTIILTYGLTLLAPPLWWGYIVYKEANK